MTTPTPQYGKLTPEEWEIVKRCIPEVTAILIENERYRLFYGELPAMHGQADVMLAYKTYNEKASFHENFGNYLEALKTKLKESVDTPLKDN